MLKVYIDRGEKQDNIANDGAGIVTVAATAFKPTGYKQFVRPWNRMLRAWGASAFHATDFYPGAEEFERETPERKALFNSDSRRIPAMIAEHVHRIAVIAFRPREFAEQASEKWKENFGTETHAVGVQMCMLAMGYWREAKCPSASFAYFHESGDPDEAKVNESVRLLRTYPEYHRLLSIRSFTMVDKGIARGLEASDFIAWHWNKHYIDKMKNGNSIPRKDFAAFTEVAERKMYSAFVTGEKLKDFFRTSDPFINGSIPG